MSRRKTKRTLVRKRQWLRPQNSPGPESTMHQLCLVRTYPGGSYDTYSVLSGGTTRKDSPPHFSVDCDLSFRDCSNSVSFDLSCYELKHFKRNREVLRKIKAAVTELEIALNEAETICQAHMEAK